MEKDAGSEWSAQVTQLPAGDIEILEEKDNEVLGTQKLQQLI